ncbi:unnamed protein product [Sphagnum jensenii]|uniref:Uncharacterized protein n=1 Tax=Sphagnum jensenii TaxID=128206 RepID=A0ABP1AFH6_9BRYO
MLTATVTARYSSCMRSFKYSPPWCPLARSIPFATASSTRRVSGDAGGIRRWYPRQPTTVSDALPSSTFRNVHPRQILDGYCKVTTVEETEYNDDQ